MPLYETTLVARQDLSHQDAEKLADHFTKIVEENGGKTVKREYWGLLDLAYIIKKNKKGHYNHICFDAPFAAIKEMQRLMGINEDIIRTLVVRVEAISSEPSYFMNPHSASYADQN